MSYEQDDSGHRPGCAPHEFGNALAWKWTRAMPKGLKGGFLTMLYAMRAMASASGEMRFSGDGKPIRIQDIAKAAGCREQDARRYLEAAMRAGVVVTIGERRRGKPTLYALVLCPCPTWEAAADYLRSTARPRKSDDESSGHSGPNSEGEVRATEARTGAEGVRSTEARMGSVHRGTNGSGHSGPNNPGVTQEPPQEMADVVPQPQERAGEEAEDDSLQQHEKAVTAARPDGPEDRFAGERYCRCGQRIMRADRDRCAGCIRADDAEAKAAKEAAKGVQGAFLLPLAGGGESVPAPRRERPRLPQEDPLAPLRVCACGREFRLRDSDRCPDCVFAAEEQQRALKVSNA